MNTTGNPPAFRCDVTEAGSRIEIELAGELDIYTSEVLRTRVGELGDIGGRHVVIDLAGVQFIDSSGLSALVHTLKHSKDSQGVVTLRRPSEQVRKLLEISGLSRLFTIA
jgi:anti-sigma B factor antagonist